MQTIKIKTYTFDELEENAQKKVLEDMRDINTDYQEWDEPIIEAFIENVNKLGYQDTKVLYSGFWSQGDGACFTATIDIERYLKTHKLCNKYRALYNQARAYSLTISIEHNWRYYYSTSTTIEYSDNYEIGEKAENQIYKLIEVIEQEREELGNKLYKDLKAYYYELQEDSIVSETIRANDYIFTEDGNRSINL